MLSKNDADRVKKLLANLNLPVELNFDKNAAMLALGKDKKRENDNIKFVLLNGIGDAVVEDIPVFELEQICENL